MHSLPVAARATCVVFQKVVSPLQKESKIKISPEEMRISVCFYKRRTVQQGRILNSSTAKMRRTEDV